MPGVRCRSDERKEPQAKKFRQLQHLEIQGNAFLPFSSVQFSSVQFSRSVMSDSLRPHELQHARTPCPSPTHGVHPNSCPSSQWCHPAISSCVVPFSSCPQSLPASQPFPMSQLFPWGGQSVGVSALASVLPKNTQDWSPLECHTYWYLDVTPVRLLLEFWSLELQHNKSVFSQATKFVIICYSSDRKLIHFFSIDSSETSSS